MQLWELWNLRALDPDADIARLTDLHRRRRSFGEREKAALLSVQRGELTHLAPGRAFLAAHPELRSGMIVTMHIGPYQFLPEPFVAAGLSPLILLDERAHAKLAPQTRRLQRRLGHRIEPEWLPIADPSFIRSLIKALRDERPVLVFLDGNGGLGGFRQTREQGMKYRLPGRDIKVRTGLARLACRLACPVHPLVLRWSPAGSVIWHKEESQQWGRGDDPAHVTRLLYDWGFNEVLATPEQWFFWDMLKESYACFADSAVARGAVPSGLRRDFSHAFAIALRRTPRTVRVVLEKDLALWPGDLLVDLSDDRFYAAEGLSAEQLDSLSDDRATLAALSERWGEGWVRFHVLRLCLLGLARLRGC